MLRRSDPFCAAVPGEAALRVPAAIAFHGPTEMALCHAIGQGEAALTPACALRLRARASMGRSCAGTAGPEGGAVLQQWLLASNYHIPDDHRRVGFFARSEAFFCDVASSRPSAVIAAPQPERLSAMKWLRR